MKLTLKIARTELALLFYSPIAWFLLIAFVFQSGLAYTGALDSYLSFQDMGTRAQGNLIDLTFKIFSSPFGGIWHGLVNTLYLYLPLLTMGLMSREISTGTIRLLNSSPLTVRQIVVGKYIAMLVYNAVLTSVLILIIILAMFNIHAVDTGSLIAAVLGVYLILCTYASIGLFMSCLTSYQVVAALSTLVMLAVLSYVGQLWQDVPVVKELAYFLSITGRVDKMLDGLVTSKDVLYFLIIIFLFLGFSIYKLRSDMDARPLPVKIARYAGLLAGALTLGYITSLPRLIIFWDGTYTKKNTLTENSQKILRQMGDTALEVTSYINLLDGRFMYGLPAQQTQDGERWANYRRFKPDISLNYVYYYDTVAGSNILKGYPGETLQSVVAKQLKGYRMDSSLFKTPEEIRRIIDLGPEKKRYVMQLKYKDRYTFLRLFNDNATFPMETETDAALKRLLSTRMPHIVFAEGQGERSIDKAGDRHYKRLTNEITFRFSLINQGFDVSTIALAADSIPADITALVIADPKIGFDSAAMTRLHRYIDGGGNLLLAAEPGHPEIFDPLLRPLGLHLQDGMLVEKSKDYSPELIQTQMTPFAAGLTSDLQLAAKDSLCVSMRGAAALITAPDGPFKVTPLLLSPAGDSWNKKTKLDTKALEAAEDLETPLPENNGFVLQMAAATHKPAADTPTSSLVYTPGAGDSPSPLPAMVALTRMVNGKEQRIAVAGDADFLSNLELGQRNLPTCNFEFSTALFSWFSYGQFPIETSRPMPEDNQLNLTDHGFALLKLCLLWIFPAIILAIGAILLIRRKRQ